MPAQAAVTARALPSRAATRASTVTALLAIPAILLLLALPAFASRALLQELFYVFTMLALAQLWNLLAGSAGLISVGQQAFVGVGAYALFAFTVVRRPRSGARDRAGRRRRRTGRRPGGADRVPPARRLFRHRHLGRRRGLPAVLAQVKQLGGGTGTSLPPDIASSMVGLDFVRDLFAVRGPAARDILAYWLALLLAVGTFVLVYRLLRSRYGLALSAIGDSEAAAESTGVDVFRTKLLIYVADRHRDRHGGRADLPAEGEDLAGCCLLAHRLDRATSFSSSLSAGSRPMEGPIIGVAIFYLLQYYLAALGSWYLILLGALAILLMLFAPTGVWGLISHSFDISLFPVRRRLIVRPSAAHEKKTEN